VKYKYTIYIREHGHTYDREWLSVNTDPEPYVEELKKKRIQQKTVMFGTKSIPRFDHVFWKENLV